MSLSRRIPTWARLLAAPALLLGVLWAVDFASVATHFRRARPEWLAASLATAVAANLASSWRWRSMVRWLGHRMGLARAAAIYFQAVAINALLPGAVVGGDVFRIAALRRRGHGLLEASTSVVLDRLSGLWIMAAMGLLAAAWGLAARAGDAGRALATLGLPPTSAAALLLLAFACLSVPAVALWAARRAAPASTPRIARMQSLALRPRAGHEALRQTVGSAVVQGLSVAAWACAARAFEIDLPYWAYVIAAVPIFLLASLPISFGGWGTREAAAGLAFAAFGVAPAAGVAVSVMVGLLGLLQALAGAALLLLDRSHRGTGGTASDNA